MAWAKLDTDVLGDVKLMRASRKGARHLQLWPWLIAFAKAADDGGRLSVGGLPADPEDIASQIPSTRARDVSVCCENLLEIGVLVVDDDGAYRLTNWSRHQHSYPSDDPAAVAERVRDHRAKQRAAKSGHHENPLHVTSGNEPDVTNGNESVKRGALAREQSREEQSREEEITKVVTASFAEAWLAYPKRAGTNSRHDAERAWDARLKVGTPSALMLAGTKRYRAFCEQQGQVGTPYVMQASRFFGTGRHFEELWTAEDPMPPLYGADGTTYTPEWLAWNERQEKRST